MFATHPAMAKRWAGATPSGPLPEHVGDKRGNTVLDGLTKTTYLNPLSRQIPPMPKQRHTARGHGGKYAKVNPAHNMVKPMPYQRKSK
jgi:hypothetical protein